MTFNLAVSINGNKKVFCDFPATMTVDAARADIAEMYGVDKSAVKVRNVVKVR